MNRPTGEMDFEIMYENIGMRIGSQTICTISFPHDKDMPVRRAPVHGGGEGASSRM